MATQCAATRLAHTVVPEGVGPSGFRTVFARCGEAPRDIRTSMFKVKVGMCVLLFWVHAGEHLRTSDQSCILKSINCSIFLNI